MDDNKDKQENIEIPEKKISADEQTIEFKKEGGPAPEKKEISPDEKIVEQELRREIELMQVDDNLKKQAEEKATQIHSLSDDEKLKHLLEIAREKGIVYAIKVAKSMNDPFLLDTLHDILAKEGFYKKIGKTTDDDNKT